MKKSLLFLHHSAINDTNPQFARINASHKARDFPKSSFGFHCGYMFVIEWDGTIVQARKEDEIGAHTYVSGKRYNEDGIGICLAGDFTQMQPSAAQLGSLASLSRSIVDRWGIEDKHIYNHKDVKATACPGYDFADFVIHALHADTAFSGSQGIYSASAQLKRLQRALRRATGKVADMIQRQIDRLLRRA